MRGQTSSYVLTTLLASPASSQLTTLATVKTELGIDVSDKSKDAPLTRYINGCSAWAARYCNRVFGLSLWQDEFRPQRGVWGEGTRLNMNPLKLSRWPLAQQPPVAFTGNTANLSPLVQGVASSASAGMLAGMPVFGAGIPVGALIQEVQPYSVLLTVPATATAAAVPLTAGMNVVETVAGVATTLVAGTDFEIDAGSLEPGDEGPGSLYRLNSEGHPKSWPSDLIVVIYQAGYALPGDANPNIPEDLEDTIVRMVTWRFNVRGQNPLLRSRDQPGLGREDYWVGAVPGQTGPYPNDVMDALHRYRVPVVA